MEIFWVFLAWLFYVVAGVGVLCGFLICLDAAHHLMADWRRRG